MAKQQSLRTKQQSLRTLMRRQVGKDAAAILEKVASMLKAGKPRASIKKEVKKILWRDIRSQAAIFLPRLPTRAPLQ